MATMVANPTPAVTPKAPPGFYLVPFTKKDGTAGWGEKTPSSSSRDEASSSCCCESSAGPGPGGEFGSGKGGDGRSSPRQADPGSRNCYGGTGGCSGLRRSTGGKHPGGCHNCCRAAGQTRNTSDNRPRRFGFDGSCGRDDCCCAGSNSSYSHRNTIRGDGDPCCCCCRPSR